MFDAEHAEAELRRYRRRGPRGSTRKLLSMVKAGGVERATLLDIGGGVGAISHSLLQAGAAHATQADLSESFLAASRSESERRGLAERLTLVAGDAVELADGLPDSDVVTLDRVLCCYPDMRALVDATASHARRTYGVVYPRRSWWMRMGVAVVNAVMRVRRSTFRVFVHRPSQIQEAVARHGLARTSMSRGILWEVAVFRRARTDAPISA
jgi:magnesium-protoporphyrin O-methyltransferase